MGSKAIAIAHPNIALVKYWGKRDERLILPHQSSLSVTLAPISVTTCVELGVVEADSVEINGALAEGAARDRVIHVLEQLRSKAKLGPARVISRGDFPAAAGLASSAAAFAALAVAARTAAGLPRMAAEESRLARLGSGSACRSIEGGVCVWRRGERADGEDSFAEQLFPEDHWPQLRLLIALIGREEKEVKSRDGMKSTVQTSPYYPAWVEEAEAEVPRAIALIQRRDLAGLGELAERNAWRMHATALAAAPPLCYLKPATLELIARLREQRGKGAPMWFTLDAGPNPVILTDQDHEAAAEALALSSGASQVVRCVPGAGVRVV